MYIRRLLSPLAFIPNYSHFFRAFHFLFVQTHDNKKSLVVAYTCTLSTVSRIENSHLIDMMIHICRHNILFALCALLSCAKAWEIPSFLLDSLPQLEQSTADVDVRQLQNSTANETVYNDQGYLDEPVLGDQGTAAPTESPAPSPSPSDTPTIAPTITGNPTSKPTASPTESPAPSPSPSDAPTSLPSGAPSIPPSESPTISNPPSMMPTVAPSDGPTTFPSISPSNSPTISSPPSLSPSQAPSDAPTSIPSVLPSSAPTLVDEVTADFKVYLSIETGKLNTTQIQALEEATTGFVSKDVTLSDGKLSQVVVQFVGQVVIDASTVNSTASNNTARKLFDNLSLQQKLVVDFSVFALYSGPEYLFDLNAALDPLFQDPASRWFKWLSTADTVFAPLSPEPTTPAQDASIQSVSNSSGSTGVPGGTIAIVTILALASLAVGIAASIYSIRQYRRNLYGQELSSPRESLGGFGSYSQDEGVEVQQEAFHQEVPVAPFPKTKNPLLSRSASADETTSAQSWMKPPNSPNSLEMGKAIPIQEIMNKHPKLLDGNKKDDAWNHIQLNKSESRIDPPTANSVINVPIAKKAEPKFQDPRLIGSLLDTNVCTSCRKTTCLE